jgi:DNA invertase Pin-like site-specific DNA recombinase
MNQAVTPQSSLAAFYARVSTSKQEYSLDIQLERARHYANTRNLNLADAHVFQDSETSKKVLANREGGARLLNAIAYQASIGAPIGHLIITKLDRLDRTTRYFLESIETINAAGITLHITDFMGDSLTTGSAMGKFFLTIMSAFAELERSFINERTSATLQHLRDRNICTGSIPYGKIGIPIPGATTKSGGQQYKLIDNRAEIQAIQVMAEMRDNGHSYKAIADHLNLRGIPTKTGANPWQCGNVSGVLQSKTTAEILSRFNPKPIVV